MVPGIGVGIHVKRPGQNKVIVESELPGPVGQGFLEIDVGQALRLSIQGGHGRAEVPFADVPGPITSSLEKLPEGKFLSVGSRSAKPPGAVVHRGPKPPRVSTGHQRPPGGSANRGVDVCVGEAQATFSQRIDVRRVDQATFATIAVDVPDT